MQILSPILTNQSDLEHFNHFSSLSIQLWHGRTITPILGFLKSSAERVGQFVLRVLYVLNEVCQDPRIFGSILKKMNRHILPVIEEIRSLPDHYKALKTVLESAIGIIDSIQIAADIDYFANGKYKKSSQLAIAGNMSLFVAHLGSGLAWMGRTGFVNLENVAISIKDLSIGNIRIFSLGLKTNANLMIEGFLALSYALFSTDNICQLYQTKNSAHKTYLELELAKNITEFSLAVMLIGGVMNAAGIILVNSVCIGFGISSVIYKVTHDASL